MGLVLRELREQGIAPSISISREQVAVISARAGKEMCTVFRERAHASLLQAWCGRMVLEYFGEEVAGTSFRVMQELL